MLVNVDDLFLDLQLTRLYRSGHVFVLPTQAGEGAGLPFIEAMSNSIPVIATGWGSHTGFPQPRQFVACPLYPRQHDNLKCFGHCAVLRFTLY